MVFCVTKIGGLRTAGEGLECPRIDERGLGGYLTLLKLEFVAPGPNLGAKILGWLLKTVGVVVYCLDRWPVLSVGRLVNPLEGAQPFVGVFQWLARGTFERGT